MHYDFLTMGLFDKNALGFVVVTPDSKEGERWTYIAKHAGWRPVIVAKDEGQLLRLQADSRPDLARVLIDTAHIRPEFYEMAIHTLWNVSVGLLHMAEPEKKAAGVFATSPLRAPDKKIRFLQTDAEAYEYTTAPVLVDSSAARVFMYGGVWATRFMEVALSLAGWGSNKVIDANLVEAHKVAAHLLDPNVKAVVATGDYAPGTAIDLFARQKVSTELIKPASLGEHVVGDIIANKVRSGLVPVFHLPGVRESLEEAMIPLVHALRCVAVGLSYPAPKTG